MFDYEKNRLRKGFMTAVFLLLALLFLCPAKPAFAASSVEKKYILLSVDDTVNVNEDFRSNNKSVAKVKNGILIAKDTGTATLTRTTKKGKTKKIIVKVVSGRVFKYHIILSSGDSDDLPKAKYSNVRWTISGSDVIYIKGDEIFGKKEGTCTLTAQYGCTTEKIYVIVVDENNVKDISAVNINNPKLISMESIEESRFLLPDFVYRMFMASGEYFVVEDMLPDEYEAISAAGYHDATGIYIKTVYTYAYVAIHEVGHYFNNAIGRPAQTEEFYEIYLREKHTIREYAQLSVNEYFAEAFMEYILDPYKSMDQRPLTSSFLENLGLDISSGSL